MMDATILFLLVAMFVIGFARGTLHQLWVLAVLALGAFFSGLLYPPLAAALADVIPNTDARKMLSFFAIFVTIGSTLNVFMDVLIHQQSQRWDEQAGYADRTAGAILGLVEAIGYAEVAAAVTYAFPLFGWDALLSGSRLLSVFFKHWPYIMPLLPAELQRIMSLFP